MKLQKKTKEMYDIKVSEFSTARDPRALSKLHVVIYAINIDYWLLTLPEKDKND